jgi:hypothetical protein
MCQEYRRLKDEFGFAQEQKKGQGWYTNQQIVRDSEVPAQAD